MRSLPYYADTKVVKKDNFFISIAKQTVSKTINYFVQNNTQKGGASDQVYKLSLLENYDRVVWDFNSPHLWRIQKQEISQLFADCLGENRCKVALGIRLFLKDHVLGKEG